MCHHYKGAKHLPKWMVDEFTDSVSAKLVESVAAMSGSYYPLSTVPVLQSLDEPDLIGMSWGLLPSWWKPRQEGDKPQAFQRKTFNARCETVHEKPTYRAAFKSRRCLVPVVEFLEKGHYFHLPELEPFCFAGLWEPWGEEFLSCTILTTEPNQAVESVGHHRMPVMLTTAEDCQLWMNPDHSEPQPLVWLFEPYVGELLSYPVEKA